MMGKSMFRKMAVMGIIGGALILPAGIFGQSSTEKEDLTAHPTFRFPLIKNFGGIVSLPEAMEQPKAGSKIHLDVMGLSNEKKVPKGLERAALILNQYVDAGVEPSSLAFSVILHGPATKSALSDESYSKYTNVPKNPSRELIRQLTSAGIEVFVCGQALAHHQYGLKEVMPEVRVAVSAATVNVNKQMAGSAYIPFP